MAIEDELHTLNSIEEASEFMGEYETSSITELSCYNSDKGFRKDGKFNI